MKTIAIIGALEKEVREVASAVDGAVTTQEAGLTVLAGTYPAEFRGRCFTALR